MRIPKFRQHQRAKNNNVTIRLGKTILNLKYLPNMFYSSDIKCYLTIINPYPYTLFYDALLLNTAVAIKAYWSCLSTYKNPNKDISIAYVSACQNNPSLHT